MLMYTPSVMKRIVASSRSGLISHIRIASATMGLKRFITNPNVYAKKVEASQISKLYIGMIRAAFSSMPL